MDNLTKLNDKIEILGLASKSINGNFKSYWDAIKNNVSQPNSSKKNINLSNLRIGVKSFKQINTGTVIFKCNRKEDIQIQIKIPNLGMDKNSRKEDIKKNDLRSTICAIFEDFKLRIVWLYLLR